MAEGSKGMWGKINVAVSGFFGNYHLIVHSVLINFVLAFCIVEFNATLSVQTRIMLCMCAQR